MINDQELFGLLSAEQRRQARVINLIASENYVSQEVLKALGSGLVNKYAEGYPGARYYGGNEISDQVELLCQQRALDLFGLSVKKWSVNVQTYSGSPANLAVYLALVPPGGKIMGMELSAGGHLTHGHRVSVSGQLWHQVPYGVDRQSEQINYDELMAIAKTNQPQLIVAGFTAYPRRIDWSAVRRIADQVGAYLMVDMSHLAGLIAGGVHPSPFPVADIVTTTTHKTLRGPRSALIFSRLDQRDLPKKINRAVFPGLQGGPHLNQIAAVAVALREAKSADFKKYAKQVVSNAKSLAKQLQVKQWRLVSGGTDNHLLLVDVAGSTAGRLTGQRASYLLEQAGIIVNKNAIPFDSRPPQDPSGIRLGSAAETTRGLKTEDFKILANRIDKIWRHWLADDQAKNS